MEYLDFKPAKCKDCFKCLRECPVKAIRFENHQAKIIADKCILCGRCTVVCPQNAKKVHSETDEVTALLKSGRHVIASVAPSFCSSFDINSFSAFEKALKKLGFFAAEETAVGAREVTKQYEKLLESGKYKNFITSACPAINRMLQIYYPSALKYLAPVASPMIAHARILQKKYPGAKIVFIGPCIAKKREAAEHGCIDAVLTFEELDNIFKENSINLKDFSDEDKNGTDVALKNARYYPINQGIIKSFTHFPKGYEYIAIDGVDRSFEALEDIDSLSGMFIEVNCCEHACINGPCAIKNKGGDLKANEDVRKFVTKEGVGKIDSVPVEIDTSEIHPELNNNWRIPSEREIKEILARTGKVTPEDELNCGACGYNTCREKAIAVYNGVADIEMCIPYMRSRAELVSHELVRNSLSGIVVLDGDYRIIEINNIAKDLLGVDAASPIGMFAFECFGAEDFMTASVEHKSVARKKIFISKTKKYAELSITYMPEHKISFGILSDITDKVEYNRRLDEVRLKTLSTTDAVIEKQMRVAQEIASLLGETTAETKVALLKLKQTLNREDED